MEYMSVSQGIFFRKRKKGGSERDDALTVKYYEGFSPPVSTVGIRSELYRNHASKLKSVVQDLTTRWNMELTERVLEYVRDSATSMTEFQGAITPMAFIISGMPGDENGMLFQSVFTEVKEFSPHAAFISSKMCLNVKASFQYLCKQIIEDDQQFADYPGSSTEEDDMLRQSPTQSQTIASRKVKHISANDLKSWYGKITERPPIVICIEDIDLFPLKTVQNIIMSFSCIKLPIVFISGITSCCETFETFVPQKCPTTFVYKTFEPISPEKRLEELMNQVLQIQDSPFQLGGEVINYVANTFLNEEFSVTRLEQAIRLCLLEHYRLAESVLCADTVYLKDKVLKSEVLSADVINASFSDDSVKLAPRMKLSLNGDWRVTKFISSPRQTVRQTTTQLNDLNDHVISFRERQLEWRIYQEFLLEVVRTLPGIPEGFQSNYRLFVLCSNGSLFQVIPDDEFKETPMDKVGGILKLLARSQLEQQLKKGLHILKLRMEELVGMNTCKTNLPTLVVRVEQYLEKLGRVDEEENSQQVAGKNKCSKLIYKSQSEFLQAMKEKVHQSGQVYAKLQGIIIKDLLRDARAFLKPLSDHPYARVFIFDDVEFLREMITPNTHKRIHAALVEPEKFLKCKRCSNDSEELHIKSDVAIVYGLILEQQMKNANLNIIFESFRSQVEVNTFSDVSTPKKRKSATKNSRDLQEYLIRFRQAIAELQHMGFIKHSKSRIHPDEVSRLHFGF